MKLSTAILSIILAITVPVQATKTNYIRQAGHPARRLQEALIELATSAEHTAEVCALTAAQEAEAARKAEKQAQLEKEKAEAQEALEEKRKAANAAKAAEMEAKRAAEKAREMAVQAKDAAKKGDEAAKKAQEIDDKDTQDKVIELAGQALKLKQETEESANTAQTLATRSAELAAIAQASVGEESGGAMGDPHVKTWKGHRFDFHGECDLILIKSADFGGGVGLDLHIRTEMRRNWSFINSAVLKIGDETLEVESGGIFHLNGVRGASEIPDTFAGFQLTHDISRKGRLSIDIHLGGENEDHSHIYFREYHEFVSVTVIKGDEENFGDSTGLMGSYHTGGMVGRDGTTIIEEPNAFGLEWQVRDNEPMLFSTTRAPQFPKVCKLPSAKEMSRRRRLMEDSPVSREDVVKACANWGADIEMCIYDVLSTGDLAMADAGTF